jgi:8-oxo-dGTP pyrophosphatase MutT (NUDIX family)
VKTRNEVSAGGVVFRAGQRDGFEVALILTHERRWQLPKGWVEADESPEDAAVREVREEAGVEAEMIGRLDTIEYWYRSKYDPGEPVRVHKFVHFFLLRYLRGSTDDHDHEVREARFVPIDDAVAMLAFPSERKLVEMARDALSTAATTTDDGNH